VLLGAPQASSAVVESALQRFPDEKSTASQQACLSSGGNVSSCSRQAKASLHDSGIPPQEVNCYVQDHAARQAVESFASCQRSGNNLASCAAEAKTLFSGLGATRTSQLATPECEGQPCG